ncbi:aspartate aminotransferase family protein [Salegentibacter salarius]|uniref:Acetylornithine aminotransferase n=1 Tax=Salegentibacter salarius TaxID=435906 RepID=A0A2N0U5E3_9FLAO|nr:aminotransferase class III-fold pyridoxal phosphate-dependent enzyme [Salegentibacter salarius]OEY74030.1 acetylornithine aminotransferase [Salegentibacter salarius]PKD22231.1 acetylornithine aminotransferase [Salegentibacter salarius]SLJ86158.1 acetylornithine aminotransferase [Salegentibacter salarius]
MELFDVYPLYDITPVKGKGAFVYDKEGNKYLDLYGGHAVISIGHSHPAYVNSISKQVSELGFYSNSVKNPLQNKLADKLEKLSGIEDYSLFLCNSGAEANENALKVASFHTGKDRVIYFKNAFHGRTSGVVSVTDNEKIKAPFNQNHRATKIAFEDSEALENELKKGDVAAVIFEVIQGVGGLDEASSEFYQKTAELCEKYNSVLIADEVQSGYGRTGDFFAFQKHEIRPDIISVAKGMGNGFPIGGVLIDKAIEAKRGMLGTTFGGNHLACAAGIAVLEVIEKENLLKNAAELFEYVKQKASDIPQIKKIKGRGLMIGLEFDFEIAQLRKELLYKHQIFTGASANKKLLRILPPLNIKKEHFDELFKALKIVLN